MKKLFKKIIPAKVWFILSIIKNKTNTKNTADTDNSLSIAVAVHVYYMDRVEQIMEYISNIPYKHTLYFTVCEESKSKLNHILKKYSIADYQVIVVENSGYDIFPFLKLLPFLTEQNHDLVCKIHTKKGAANLEKQISGIDDVWFKTLMDSVLGSRDLVKKITFAFESDKELGMIGPASLYKSAQKLMYGNEAYATDILNKISYDTADPATDWGFFAGSMFWARLDVFKPLIQNQKLNRLLNDAIDMKTGRYASAFHGMERVFGKLPSLQCMKTGLTYNLDIENKANAVQILDTEKIYSPVGVGMTLQNEHELEKNHNRLKDSPWFDKNFYLEHSATCKKVNMDPLLHFLRYGVYQNEMPNENLSPFVFWSVNKKYFMNRINPLIALTDISRIQNPVVNMPENINIIMEYIKKSGLFDKKYYVKENPGVVNNAMTPLLHYCRLGYKEGRKPCPEFDAFWYESEYLNQCMGPVNPLLHYILSGKKKGCKTKPSYKNKASVSKKPKQQPKRITLFAAYDPDGMIDESVLIFVKELSKYSDVYFLSDANLQNSELKKITPFVKGAWGIRHEEYDFGSYMRLAKYFAGWETIEKYDELLFVNDSSYLISSLAPVFNKMDKKNISWWGMQATKGWYATKDKKSNCFKNKIPLDKVKNTFLKDYFQEDPFDFHIGSYFLVFRKNIIKDKNFQNFINNISRQKNKTDVILKYEIGLTKYLLSRKYDFDTYMDFLYPFHPVYTDVIYEMIEEGFPLFKRFFLTENHYKQKKLYKWKERLLKFYPDLHVKPIEDNLYRMADTSKLYKNLDIENNDITLRYAPVSQIETPGNIEQEQLKGYHERELFYQQERREYQKIKQSFQDLRHQLQENNKLVDSLLSSYSWRITAPLRAVNLWVKQNRLFMRFFKILNRLRSRNNPAASPVPDKVKNKLYQYQVTERPVPKLKKNLCHKSRTKIVAFYLPQFHAIPENDRWWGKGFTEWTNVKPAVPQFDGHYQPHVPGELGYYDLTDKAVMKQQVTLAKKYGLGGFCFYFYWFAGKRLLEAPLLAYLEDDTLDFPFCLAWANENWSRRWDGMEHDILIRQAHSPDDDINFIRYLSRYLADPRYIRIDTRPLLIVYRPNLLPSARTTARRWRKWCREHGIGEIYLAYTQGFENLDPAEYGFDAAIEFPPNKSGPPNITKSMVKKSTGFKGTVYDWRALVERSFSYTPPEYTLFRGVNPSWDNTARKKQHSIVFAHSTPFGYLLWLLNALQETVLRTGSRDERLVFVNAWNEWAEGAHLEPDEKYGFGFLEATRMALCRCDLSSPGTKCAIDPLNGSPESAAGRVAIIIHAFYLDVFQELVEKIKMISGDYKLFVTTPHEHKEQIQALLAGASFPCHVLGVENRGRDVRSFLKIIYMVVEQGFSYFLKIHTKKSSHRQDGDVWRNDLYAKLLDPEKLASMVNTCNADQRIGLIGPGGHLVSMTTYLGSNRDRIKWYAERMGLSMDEVLKIPFVAGTMFFARISAVFPLLCLGVDDTEFEPEKGQVDGTLAHSIERLFSISTVAAGMKIVDTYYVQDPATAIHVNEDYAFV